MTARQSGTPRPFPLGVRRTLLGERRGVADQVHDLVTQKFPMVPDRVIAVLTACAIEWLTAGNDTVTVSAVRPLVVESLELRLGA
jgi:hypothetical protein